VKISKVLAVAATVGVPTTIWLIGFTSLDSIEKDHASACIASLALGGTPCHGIETDLAKLRGLIIVALVLSFVTTAKGMARVIARTKSRPS
jgi:hypothetical protein